MVSQLYTSRQAPRLSSYGFNHFIISTYFIFHIFFCSRNNFIYILQNTNFPIILSYTAVFDFNISLPFTAADVIFVTGIAFSYLM